MNQEYPPKFRSMLSYAANLAGRQASVRCVVDIKERTLVFAQDLRRNQGRNEWFPITGSEARELVDCLLSDGILAADGGGLGVVSYTLPDWATLTLCLPLQASVEAPAVGPVEDLLKKVLPIGMLGERIGCMGTAGLELKEFPQIGASLIGKDVLVRATFGTYQGTLKSVQGKQAFLKNCCWLKDQHGAVVNGGKQIRCDTLLTEVISIEFQTF